MILLLDTHAVHWWSSNPKRLSRAAAAAVSKADELAVADVSWFELSWHAHHDRIVESVA